MVQLLIIWRIKNIDDYLQEGKLLYEQRREVSMKENQSIIGKINAYS